MRLALGAETRHLVMQSIMEVLPIAFAGGIAGVIIAAWTIDALIPFVPPGMPRVDEIGLSAPVLAFAFASVLFVALITGLLPAWHARRTNLIAGLQDSSRGSSSGPTRARIRDVIVAR